MTFKYSVTRRKLFEWANELLNLLGEIENDPKDEVEDLHRADEWEASEEPHGASHSRHLLHKLGCSVLNVYRVISVSLTTEGSRC